MLISPTRSADAEALLAHVARSWALLAFAVFAHAVLPGLSAEEGACASHGWCASDPRLLGGLLAVMGGVFALFVAAYDRRAARVTNRPIWSDTPLLGLNFVLSPRRPRPRC